MKTVITNLNSLPIMKPPTLESTSASAADRSGRRMIIAGFVFLATYLIARFALPQPGLHPGLKIGLCVLPPVAGVIFLLAILRVVRAISDELQRRIQLEALALAFPAGFLLVLLLSLFQMSGLLKPDPWDYWLFLLPMYPLGLWMANRRYR